MRLRSEVQRLRRELEALQETAATMADGIGLDDALDTVVRRAASLVEGTVGFLYLLDEEGAMRMRVVTVGLDEWLGTTVAPGDGLVGRVWQRGEPLAVNDYRSWLGKRADMEELRPCAVAGVPLRASATEGVVGVLGLGHLEPVAFSDDDLAVLDRFGGLAAIALQRVRLNEDLRAELDQRRRTEDELLDAVARLTGSEHALRLSHEEMVRRLAAAAEFRDVQTSRHVERVGATCARVARRLGFDESFCESIRVASPLHDIGKIGIPDRVLLKPGSLTVEEREVIERHAEIGYRILSGAGSELLDLAASIALTHHERFDGSGYPAGLAGTEIPIEGRIAAVADVFDALTTDRVYRPSYPADIALELVRDGRRTQFDPAVVDAFFAVQAELVGAEPTTTYEESFSELAPAAGNASGLVLDSQHLRHAAIAAVDELRVASNERQLVDAAMRRFSTTAGTGVIASVYLLDHELAWCVAQHGYDQVRDGFDLSQGVMGRCLRTGETQFVPVIQADADYIGAMGGIVSELTVPLTGHRSLAAFNVETLGVGLPADAEQAIEPLVSALTEVMDRMSASLSLDLSTLAHICVHASSLRGIGPLTEFATRTTGRLLELQAVQLDLGPKPSGPTASFWRRPNSALTPIAASRLASAIAGGLSDTVVAAIDGAGAGIVAPDDPAPHLLWLPLRVGGSIVGTLVGRSDVAIDLAPEQAEAAALLGQHIAALIDVAHALRREQRAAVTDSMTGLLNRRGFDERMGEEIARAERGRAQLALVLADCDDLKHVNDTLGHDRGDAMLQALARLIRESKRASDVAARLGGDEFAIALPEADLETATAVADRLRAALKSLSVNGRATTASFGIALYPNDGTTTTALLRAADRALYAAKHGGKDRLATVA